MKYAEVYIDIKTPEVNQPFDYEIPENLIDEVKPGCPVLVPFRNRREKGFVSRVKSASKINTGQIKQIEEIIDAIPAISLTSLKLIHWMSVYFIQPLSKIKDLFAPPAGIKKIRNFLKKYDADPSVFHGESCAPDICPEPEKQVVFPELEESINSRKFKGLLIHNILKDQKSNLINTLCVKTLNTCRNVIILVPEIQIAEGIYSRLDNALKKLACIYHSEKSEPEKLRIWYGVFFNKYPIIIGTRSAVFLPAKNTGLIIIDEEHDSSYKDMSIIRYGTREIVLKLCRLMKIPAVFISNTPSVSSYHKFKYTGEMQIIDWGSRNCTGYDFKKIIADLTGQDFIITGELHKNIFDTVKEGSKVLLFSNKKGYSSFIICKKCGYIPKCERCSTSLKYHRQSNILICHHCSRKESFSGICTRCGSRNDLCFRGTGSEKIELSLKKRFPDVKVFRIDPELFKDTESRIGFFDEMKNTNPAILISTSALLGNIIGSSVFENITLLAVLDFDGLFAMPDFHVNERVYQLLYKLGSLLKNDSGSKFIIQTRNPKNRILRNFTDNNDDAFFAEELASRKELDYPPFSNIINIVVSGINEDSVAAHAEALASVIGSISSTDFMMLGPNPAPFLKINLNYRWHIIIKTKMLLHFNSKLLKKLKGFKKDKSIKIIADVDPLWIL